MKRIPLALGSLLLLASWAMGCGSGALSDGGQSGTGIAAIRGNVVAVTGAAPDVADIRVSVAASDLATHTDASGRFELRGNVSGPTQLLFERQRDGLFATTAVVVPAGGVLDLQQIEIDSDSGEAHSARQRVQFQGVVEVLDCTGGTIRVKPNDDDPSATVFTIEVASATIRLGNVPLTCGDLQVGNVVQVLAETSDGTTLVNAEVVVEDGQNGQQVQFEGLVEAVNCAGGAIRIKPNDDDPEAPVFTVDVASAAIRRGNIPLTCGDLQMGDPVQVTGDTSDGTTLMNAEVVLQSGDDGRGDDPGDHDVNEP